MSKPGGGHNGASDVQFFGTSLPPDALRILARLTPEGIRALDRRLWTAAMYGSDGTDAQVAAITIHEAAEVCR